MLQSTCLFFTELYMWLTVFFFFFENNVASVYTFKAFHIETDKRTKLNNAGKYKLPNAIPRTLVYFSWYHLQMKALVERPR